MTLFKVNRNKTKQHSEHSEQHAGHHDQGRTMPLWTSTTGASAPDGVAWNDASSLMQSMFRSVSMTEPPTTTPTVRFSTRSSCGGQKAKTTFPLHPPKVPTFHKAQSAPPDVRSPVPPVWKVLRLHTVPIYYPMEKSAIKFSGSLVKLTNQISDFLKHHSITSVYHDEAGRVDCMTSGLLHFSVQLWKGDDEQRSENSVDGPNVIVEIQRRQGCCIEMQRLRQDLILWLQHPREETTTNPMTSITVPTASPRIMSIHVLQQLVEQSTLSDGTKTLPALTMVDCENAFRIACRLLNSSRLDERRLGLESLHVMTNSRNVMTYLADYVSSKILMDPDIQSFLLDYFVSVEVNSDDNNNNNNVDSISGDDHDGTLNYIRGRFFGEMHILALKVLANALDTMVCQHLDNNPRDNGFSFNDDVKLNLSTPLWNHALQAMLYNMHISHVRPLEACLSVRSLRRLHSLCPVALKQRLAFFDNHAQLDHSLLDARAFGQRHFSQLEHETVRFMNQLGLAY